MSRFGGRQSSDVLGAGKVIEIPENLSQDLRRAEAIPVTVSGANNRIFTLAATRSNPVFFPIGPYYFVQRAGLTYTWTTGTNSVIAADGSISSETGATVGVYYFYVGVEDDGTVSLLPSTAAPAYSAEGAFPGGTFGHPGSTKDRYWQYVGYHVCLAATPDFMPVEKNGFHYSFVAQSVATTTTWAPLDFSLVLPHHGVECMGSLQTSATLADTTEVGTSSVDGRGATVVQTPAAAAAQAPFGPIPVSAAGQIYGSSTTAAGAVHITQVKDLV